MNGLEYYHELLELFVSIKQRQILFALDFKVIESTYKGVCSNLFRIFFFSLQIYYFYFLKNLYTFMTYLDFKWTVQKSKSDDHILWMGDVAGAANHFLLYIKRIIWRKNIGKAIINLIRFPRDSWCTCSCFFFI